MLSESEASQDKFCEGSRDDRPFAPLRVTGIAVRSFADAQDDIKTTASSGMRSEAERKINLSFFAS